MIKHGHRNLSPAADAYLLLASRLQRQLLAARAAFDRASDQRIRLELLQLDDEIGSEAARLLERAKTVHRAAHQAYLIALQRYNDFATQGALYRERHAKPS